ncbi:type VII secretion-associated serine protease mycosin [Nocardia sp. NPDC006630]|uniref:type VII secretion-associated serine protease mycosin n=1 Tax=Nocardia sp. NPDC006630 TaxID=3157181 RepID=UPI0033B03C31
MRFSGVYAVAVTALALVSAAPASAVQPPQVVLGVAPADPPPGPEQPYKQDKGCLGAGVLPHSDLSQPAPPDRALNLPRARSLSRGGGVTVAVIDTGVGPNPRLPNLVGGGDYLQAGGDGLTDCDAHGTLIAGIIGATADPADGFTGVAPDARIISIRSRSGAFSLANSVNYDLVQQEASDARTLARAITHAANLGAGVITVSVPVCVSVQQLIDQSLLSAAIGYAVHVRGALIVAGAGDTNGSVCEQNPDIDPGHPTDPRNWEEVKTVATPGWFGSDVLTVGFTTANGEPMPDSLLGPWLSLGAPGTGIESLGPGGGGLVNGVGEPDKLVPVAGSSFAAAYVSGVAALLRSRFPNETPAEISARLLASAHAPARGLDNTIGAGVIDPVAALGYHTPPQPPAGSFGGTPLAMPPAPRPKDWRPGGVAAGIMAAAVLLGCGVDIGRRMLRRSR